MENLTIPAWLGKAAYAIAIAATLGGGSTVLNNARDVELLKHRVSQTEATGAKLDALDESLDETNRNIAVLNERLRALLESELKGN